MRPCRTSARDDARLKHANASRGVPITPRSLMGRARASPNMRTATPCLPAFRASTPKSKKERWAGAAVDDRLGELGVLGRPGNRAASHRLAATAVSSRFLICFGFQKFFSCPPSGTNATRKDRIGAQVLLLTHGCLAHDEREALGKVFDPR